MSKIVNTVYCTNYGTSDFSTAAMQEIFDYIAIHGTPVTNAGRKICFGVYVAGGTHGFIGYIYDNKKYGVVLILSYDQVTIAFLYDGTISRKQVVGRV